MRAVDILKLSHFQTRMGMYIHHPADQASVVAFLHGYEFGAGGECRFTAALSEHLACRYRIKPDALGWSQQLFRLAERLGLDWLEAYLLASSEVLAASGAPDT